jgi:hypothetical protein
MWNGKPRFVKARATLFSVLARTVASAQVNSELRKSSICGVGNISGYYLL